MCLCVCVINVCRWVKWTSTDIYSDHSLMSACGLITCLWLMITTCWSRTTSVIAFCCLTLNYSYNASSLTRTTLNSSCGGQHYYVTVQSRHCCVLCTAAVARRRRLTWYRCSVCAEWVTHDCFTMTYSINQSLIHHHLALFTTIH